VPFPVGKAAAESNVTVYWLFVDHSFFAPFRAERAAGRAKEQPITRDAEAAADNPGLYDGSAMVETGCLSHMASAN
jgi:hypothetical protein